MDGDVHGPAAAHDVGPATREPRPWLRRLEEIAGLIFVVAGLGLALVHYLAGADGLPNAELGALAFGAPYSALGWLAFLGSRSGRPALTLFAGMPLVFMSMVSFVTILLVLAAGLLAVRGLAGVILGRQQHLGWPEMWLPLVVTAAPVLAFGYLLFHKDPAEWRPDEHTISGTSDIITVFESALSLGAVAVAVAVSYVWIVREAVSRRG